MRVDLQQAIAKLKQGEVVAIPTETVYGLAGDARNENALNQIYAIKQRPTNNPLIVHLANTAQVQEWASIFSPLAQKLAQAFWPGPLTLVLPAKTTVSNTLRAGEPTVALRVPAHPLTRSLLQQSGLALAAPSANKYTQLSPTCTAHVEAGLGEFIPVLDGGACQIGIESTIVSVQEDDWQLLRQGVVSEAEVMHIANKPSITNTSYTPKVPGQHLLHYSPRTPTYLFKQINAMHQFIAKHQHCVALLIHEQTLACPYLTLGDIPNVAAEQLYALLHRLDAMGAKYILVEDVPEEPAWLAIRDRLQRATQCYSYV